MKIPRRRIQAAIERADNERSIGITDRDAVFDDRAVVQMDLRTHGGGNWQIEPRLGYTSCRLRDVETADVIYAGTMKQCLREISRMLVHRLGARNLQ